MPTESTNLLSALCAPDIQNRGRTFIFPAGTEGAGGAGGGRSNGGAEGSGGTGGSHGEEREPGVEPENRVEEPEPEPEPESEPEPEPDRPTSDMTDEELREAVRALLGRHEGRRPHVYLDSMGHPSIGIGFNLDRGGARQTLAALGVDYDAVRAGKADLSEDEIDWLFEHDLESAFVSARRQVQNFDRLHPSAKQVVLDMMFMGEGAFAKFRKLIAALQSFDYEAAADEIVKSRWFSQVGARGPENAERMRSAAGR